MHHLYCTPGMFGFGRLGSYSYFAHVERALKARFERTDQELAVHVIEILPTASVRRRAAKLAEVVRATSGTEGPIHLLGHSTGGLDVRLVASPSSVLPTAAPWLQRLHSITMMNTPHYGTPLASFFTTASGQRILYALSAFTYIALSLGERPLAITSVLLGALGKGDSLLGTKLLDKSVDALMKTIDDARSPEVRKYLDAITDDQGAMLQLSPEAMDLVVAGFEDRPGVFYQCVASMAPPPSRRSWRKHVLSPTRALSLGAFALLQRITARHHPHYPCAAATRDQAIEDHLHRALGEVPGLEDNDGVVPIRSQLWGHLAWAGLGDHLDVLGHYYDNDPDDSPSGLRHQDWLNSGSAFRDTQFESLMDAVAAGMLRTIL